LCLLLVAIGTVVVILGISAIFMASPHNHELRKKTYKVKVKHHGPAHKEKWKLKLGDLKDLRKGDTVEDMSVQISRKKRLHPKSLRHSESKIEMMHRQGLLDDGQYSVAKRLDELNTMHEGGLIGDEEYNDARKSIKRPQPPSSAELARDLEKLASKSGNLDMMHQQKILDDTEFAAAKRLAKQGS
jgi:hypothetical protein